MSEMIVAAGSGPSALDDVVRAQLTSFDLVDGSFDYDPRQVPMVDEFAAEAVGASETEHCVVGHLRGGPGRSLILFAHPDTEDFQPAPAWKSDPFTPTVRNGRLFGWGVADDLAGIAVMVQSIAVLREAGLSLQGDVAVVSAPSKKHRRGISAALHRGLQADAAIYLHPAESGKGLDEIKAFAPGQLEFMITIDGEPPRTNEPAHTAFAHRGVNPFDKAMVVATALKRLDVDRGERIRHPRLERAIGRSANLMVTHCDTGGEAVLSRIAPACRLGGALTLIPGEDLTKVMGAVEAAIKTACADDTWLAAHPPVIAWLSGVSAAETEAESELYRTVAGILADLGADPVVNPLHTSSDIRNPIVQKGIPTVGFGPLCGGLTMSGLADEWVDLADFHRTIAAAAEIIVAWCGVGGRSQAV
ncbi:MAG: M20/M25/M40 family metallo-hydrolase [Hyphomicrobiales bacterium]|nr:M20/M25/M40 family metallo-hydrolase [Hyphomicrobiales bacterium]